MEELAGCPICSSPERKPFLACLDHFLTKETFQIAECLDCGFRYTNPRPESGQLGKYYQSPEYISHSNTRKGIFNRIYQLVRNYTLSGKHRLITRYVRSGSILDIGCASGEFLNFMKSKGWNVTGIEPDEKTRRNAVANYGIDILDESGLSGIPDGTFDIITLWHVLEHVPDLNARMKEIHRLLKKEGMLFLAVPISDSFDAGKYSERWAGYDVPRHLYHFTRGTMNNLLDRHSFQLVKTIPMKFDAYYVSLLSEKYRSGKVNWLTGFWNGYCSNRDAKISGNYSSLVFISRKKNEK